MDFEVYILYAGRADTLAPFGGCIISWPGGVKKPIHFRRLITTAVRRITHVLGKKLNQQKTGIFPESKVWSDEMRCGLLDIAGRTAQSPGCGL